MLSPIPLQGSRRLLSPGLYGLSLMLLLGNACGDPQLDAGPAETEPAPRVLPSPRDRISHASAVGELEGEDEAAGDGAPSDVELGGDLLPESSAQNDEATNLGDPRGSAASPCEPGQGATGSPSTIPELLQLLDSLPRPTSVPCFLESLARPLYIYATRSQLSAQPADDERSPRTFIVIGDLTLSVVPSGRATELLEFGYRVSDERSVKGEIEFPLYRRLRSQDLVEQIEAGPGTLCGGCHTREAVAAPTHFAGAFESSVIPPSSYYEIDLPTLEALAVDCDAEQEPRRCAMLGALFDHGPILRTELWGPPSTEP